MCGDITSWFDNRYKWAIYCIIDDYVLFNRRRFIAQPKSEPS